MQESLTSPHWYRVASLHPRLRPHVSVRMHTTRGQAWYVLFNQATGRQHRVNAQAYELVGRMDGRFSVDEVWQLLLGQMGDAAPTQSDVIRILGQMSDAGLVQAEVVPDVQGLLVQRREREQAATQARLNPFSFRLGLFNPSDWLERLAPVGRVLWSAPVQWLWLILVLAGAWAALAQAQELVLHGRDFFLTPAYLGAMWLAYPLMKALHETAHALALRRHGCEVPEVGVNFFLFMPMPYVDASAANRLVNRWQRAHISAAGIWVELGLAALAMLVWSVVEDGWVRQGAFVVMSVGGLSTLLFNANPLMKFDGYHLMCDVLEMPNLASRSARVWAGLWRSLLARLLGVREEPDEHLAAADSLERWALRLYAPAAWMWRVMVTALLVTWVADRAALLGWGLVAWGLWSLGVQPLIAFARGLQGSPALAPVQGRVQGVVALLGAGAVAFSLWVPLPASVVAEGVVWLPNEAQVRPEVDGQVETLWVRSGQAVQAGQALMSLASPELTARRDVLASQVSAAEADFHAAYGSDALKMKNAQDLLARLQADLTRAQADVDALVLRAARDGRFVVSRPDDLEAQPVNRGQVLAWVLSQDAATVRLAIPQDRSDEVRHRLRGVEVMLDEQPGRRWPATVLREVPSAADQLPAEAMADRRGGRVPTVADEQAAGGMRTVDPVVVMDVALQQAQPRAGGLARVRLDLTPQSLGDRLWQRLGQLFLRHFSGGEASP